MLSLSLIVKLVTKIIVVMIVAVWVEVLAMHVVGGDSSGGDDRRGKL